MEIIKVINGKTGAETMIKAHTFDPSRHVSIESQVPVIEEIVEAESVEQVVEAPAEESADYSKMKKAELAVIAEERGLDTKGLKKTELIALLTK